MLLLLFFVYIILLENQYKEMKKVVMYHVQFG